MGLKDKDRETVLARAARTTGQEVLALLAIGFVGAFVWWWYQAWSVMFPNAPLLSAVGVFKSMISLVYGVVVPLFWSMLLPNSPTGSYLRKQTWAQPGQLVVLGCALALSYFGIRTMWAWLLAVAPALVDSGMFGPALIAATVGSTFVPAMQFAYQTPGQQMLLIQQAHEIRKLERLHNGELAIIEGRMMRATVLASMRWADMLPSDHAEVYHTIKGLMKGIADSQRRVARLQGVPADIQRALGIPEDKEVDEKLGQVQAWLESPADHIDRTYIEFEDTPPELPPEREDSRLQSSISRAAAHVSAPEQARPAAPELMPQRYGTALAKVQRLYGNGIWGLGDVMAACAVTEDGARDLIDGWIQYGHARVVGQNMWGITRPGAHENTRPQSSIPRAPVSDRGSQSPTVSDPVARRIAAELPRVFTAQNLADLVQQDKRSAQRTIAGWKEEGIITEVQLGRYMLTEYAEVRS